MSSKNSPEFVFPACWLKIREFQFRVVGSAHIPVCVLSAVRGLRSMVSSLPSTCFSTFGCGSAALNRATSQPTGGDEMRLESMAEQLEDKSLERSANPRFLRRLSETVLQEPNR